MNPDAEHAVDIPAPPAVVWRVLTDPASMVRWMGEPEMRLAVETDWTVGSPIVIRGFHHVAFVNRGKVLRFDPPSRLAYTHRSSISHLPDDPASHSTLEFSLIPQGSGTRLTLAISGCPSEVILRHLDLYWRGTLPILARSLP